ncbi:hypothetical protein DCS_01366 [Drechmeria coniospora]|uniref:Uncharacterized protein n=1 Tax=Drechmeria coniospora TaxID=98403 RepID=A0A151GSY4_DRECN|nr:hypothetical protein DCS_01366 [Drechmeria coniospora]KYK60229.1 hypothetical protein DCS_01366 [Drechmeria coniospora]
MSASTKVPTSPPVSISGSGLEAPPGVTDGNQQLQTVTAPAPGLDLTFQGARSDKSMADAIDATRGVAPLVKQPAAPLRGILPGEIEFQQAFWRQMLQLEADQPNNRVSAAHHSLLAITHGFSASQQRFQRELYQLIGVVERSVQEISGCRQENAELRGEMVTLRKQVATLTESFLNLADLFTRKHRARFNFHPIFSTPEEIMRQSALMRSKWTEEHMKPILEILNSHFGVGWIDFYRRVYRFERNMACSNAAVDVAVRTAEAAIAARSAAGAIVGNAVEASSSTTLPAPQTVHCAAGPAPVTGTPEAGAAALPTAAGEAEKTRRQGKSPIHDHGLPQASEWRSRAANRTSLPNSRLEGRRALGSGQGARPSSPTTNDFHTSGEYSHKRRLTVSQQSQAEPPQKLTRQGEGRRWAITVSGPKTLTAIARGGERCSTMQLRAVRSESDGQDSASVLVSTVLDENNARTETWGLPSQVSDFDGSDTEVESGNEADTEVDSGSEVDTAPSNNRRVLYSGQGACPRPPSVTLLRFTKPAPEGPRNTGGPPGRPFSRPFIFHPIGRTAGHVWQTWMVGSHGHPSVHSLKEA